MKIVNAMYDISATRACGKEGIISLWRILLHTRCQWDAILNLPVLGTAPEEDRRYTYFNVQFHKVPINMLNPVKA